MIDIQLLKKAELFSTLNNNDLHFIATKVQEQKYTKGEKIFNLGGAAINFYIVKSGEIIITKRLDDGKKHDFAKYVTGDSFAELAFITGFLHDVEAHAAKDSTLLIFPSFPNTLDSLTKEKPNTLSRLYLRSLTILSKRLRSVHTLIAQNTPWVKHLQEQIYKDSLTGLYTRLYLDSEISKLITHPTAVIIIKPDRFKVLNEIYGHTAGDAILSRLGTALLRIIDEQESGWAFRLRGNETVLVIKNIEENAAVEIAQSLCKNIQKIGPTWIPIDNNKNKPTKEYKEFRLTISIGIGIYNKDESFKQLVETTYKLMKKCWKKGGNRIYLKK